MGAAYAPSEVLQLVLRRPQQAGDPVAYRYTHAECNEERVFSTSYQRARSRVSYWVLVEYDGPTGQREPYVAKVESFVKLPAGVSLSGDLDAEGTMEARVAVASLYKAAVEADGLFVIRVGPSGEGQQGGPHMALSQCWPMYALPAQSIHHKLVVAEPPARHIDHGRIFFMKYTHLSDHNA